MSLNFDTLFGPYQDKIFINYDWVDIDSATGYVSYDGFATKDSVSIKYHLEKSSERSNYISRPLGTYSAAGNYTTAGKALDIDFDTVTFKKARIIRGMAYIKVGAGTFWNNDTGSDLQALYVIAKIRKYDGSTETEIASVQSDSSYSGVGAGAGVDVSTEFNISVDIPETVIAANESLRLTIEVWLDIETDTSVGGYLVHDPGNAEERVYTSGAFATGHTRLIFICPFKVESWD